MKKIIALIALISSSSAHAFEKTAIIEVNNGHYRTIMNHTISFSQNDQQLRYLNMIGNEIMDGFEANVSPISWDQKSFKIDYVIYNENQDIHKNIGSVGILSSEFLDGKEFCSPTNDLRAGTAKTDYRFCIKLMQQSNDKNQKVN